MSDLLLVGYHPLVSCLCLPLPSGPHRPSPLRSRVSNLLRMQRRPPPCLFPALFFSPHLRLVFFTSLPIFMPVSLCQYGFRHTRTPALSEFIHPRSALSAFIKVRLSVAAVIDSVSPSVCRCDALKYTKATPTSPGITFFSSPPHTFRGKISLE